MTTAKASLNITYIIRKDNTEVYDTSLLHLDITTKNGHVLYHSPAVTPQIAPINGVGGADGLITFSSVPLVIGNNIVRMYLAKNTLETTGVSMTSIGGISIRRFDDSVTTVTL